MNLEDFTIWTYLRIEEILKEIPWAEGLRTRGQKPDLSDLEVLTIEVLGSVQGCADDKALWRYIKDHWKPWFPKLSSYKNFAKHCANLCWLKEAILERIVKDCAPVAYIADGVPVPICHYARASRCKSFKGDAAFGYCAAKDQKYYGFKGLAVITETGRIAAFVLTAANKDERQALYDLPPFIKGLMIGDKGFIGKDHKAALHERGIDLHTPQRKNMKDQENAPFSQWMFKTRRLVETVFSKLIDQFGLLQLKARNLWHLTNKIHRTILAYNLALDFNGSIAFLKT